jgi:multicomponent Na+:H+ antiporter subunit F
MPDAASASTWIAAAAGLAIALAVLRILRGPSAADRVVALDIVFSASLALVAAMALATGRVLFLDIALGLALIGFVATVVWARVVERAGDRR